MSVVDTSKLLAESHSIIYGPNENNGCDVTLESIHSLLIQMNTKLTNIELKNDSLESRLSTIEKEIIALNEIRGSLDTVKSHVNKLNTDVTSVQSDLRSLESNVSALGNVFDSVKEKTKANRTVINNNRKSLDQCIQSQKLTENRIAEELEKMKETDEKMLNSMTDLKVRSMRDNLIFTGIPEQKGEDTEELLQDFIQRKYKLDYTISFERVHRIGKWREFNEHPRNIVAKFTYFKDREFIRTKAAQKLSGSNVWVNEQFPPEIEERRKKLYPVMRQAKKDKKRTKLVRDILYIEGEVYTPPTESAPAQSNNGQNQGPTQSSRQTPGGSYRRPYKRQRQGSTPEHRQGSTPEHSR